MPSGADIRAGAAYVELYVQNSAFARGLKRAQWRLRRFSRSVTAIGRRMALATAVMAAPIFASTRVFAGFDDRMRTVKAVTQATAEEFEMLTGKAKLLGRTTSYTARHVASGMRELGRAGFNPDEIDSAIGDILNLARATDVELGEAAERAGASLRAFGLEADDISRVVDVLAATANSSAQTLTDLGEAMKYAAPVAATYGMTIEDTSKALGALANFGIKGSMAGNTLKRVMLQLARTDIQETLAGLGVGVTDPAGNLRNVSDVLLDIGRAAGKMGQAQRVSIFSQLFGDRAVAGAAKLTAAAFDSLNDSIDNAAGTAARTAEEMDAGIGGSLRQLWSAVEGVAIAIGDAIAPAISKLADHIAPVLTMLADFIGRNSDMVVTAARWIAAFGGVSVALMGTGAAIQVVAFALGGLSVVIGAATTAVTLLMGVFGLLAGVISGPVLVAAGIVAGLGAAILHTSGAGGRALSGLGEVFGELRDTALAAFSGIRDAMAAGDMELAARILWLSLKLAFQQGASGLVGVWIDLKTDLLNQWTSLKAGVLKTWETLWFAMKEVAIKAGLAEPLLAGFHAVEAGWMSVTHAMSTMWLDLVSLVFSTWNRIQSTVKTAQEWIGSAAIDVMGFFDESLDTDAAKKMLREDYRGQQQKLEDEMAALDEQYTGKLLDLDRRQQTARDDLAGRQADRLAELRRQEALGNAGRRAESEQAKNEIAARAEEERAKREAEAEERLKAAAEALERARGEWRGAIDEAAHEREQSAESGSRDGRIKALADEIVNAGRSFGKPGGKVEILGGFNIASLRGFAAAGAADSVAANTAEMVRQQKDTNRNLDDIKSSGGTAFG